MSLLTALLVGTRGSRAVASGGGGGSEPIHDMWTGRTGLFFGDSITAGFNATVTSWVMALQAAKDDAGNNNYGSPGQYVTTTILACNPATNVFDIANIPSYNSAVHAYAFFGWGTNDIAANGGGGITSTTYRQSLSDCVDNAISKGWPAGKLVILTPYYMSDATLAGAFIGAGGPCAQATTPVLRSTFNAFCQAVRDLAAEKHTVLGDIAGAIYAQASPGALMSGDGIHLNDAGHAFVGDYLINLDYTPL